MSPRIAPRTQTIEGMNGIIQAAEMMATTI